MTTFSEAAISLFVQFCLDCAAEGVGVRSAEFIQKAGKYLTQSGTPTGFAELCMTCVAGGVLPEEATVPIKTQLQERRIRAETNVKELRAQMKRAKKFIGECEQMISNECIKIDRIRRTHEGL